MRRVTLAWIASLCLSLSASLPALARERRPDAGAKPAAQAGAKYDAAKLKVLETKLAKAPKDAKLKQEVAEANFQVGHTMMMDPALPPRVKYPGALKHFNRSLALNPKHTKAAQEKKMIEDIYRSMGRPVPGQG